MYKGPVVEAQGDEERPVWLVWSKPWVVWLEGAGPGLPADWDGDGGTLRFVGWTDFWLLWGEMA